MVEWPCGIPAFRGFHRGEISGRIKGRRKYLKKRNYSATKAHTRRKRLRCAKTQRGDKYKLNTGVFSLMSLGLINFNPDKSGLKRL